jgi:uncharacterized damage-inducible protein DinB
LLPSVVQNITMEIYKADVFLHYYQKVKARTLRVVERIPKDHLDFRLKEGFFPLGDLARHIILIERDLYLPCLQNQSSRYRGCDASFARDMTDIMALYSDTMMSMEAILNDKSTVYFQEKCTVLGGASIRRVSWLRALLEHEIHHRGQLHMQLRYLDVDIPQIYGLSSEEVIDRSEK